jgi:trimethylamine---corrinoid protein Co-methyltransferase
MQSLNPLVALSESQIAEVHTAAEHLLEHTGFTVQHGDLLRRAAKAGATIDDAGGRVRLPVPLQRELLALAPATYTIRNIAGEAHEIGGSDPCIFGITNDPWVIDYTTREPRRPCLADVVRHTALAQQIDGMACVSCMDFPVTDCSDETSPLRAFEAHLLNHTLHYAVYASSPERFRMWTEFVRILNGGEDVAGSRLITSAVAIVSPLTLTGPNGDLLLAACAGDHSIIPTICPMAGTTSPYTIASTLLVAHAENLFAAAMAQIVRPGAPFLYALGPSVSDMRTGHDQYYTLDKMLWKVAGVQLAKAQNLPCTAECGGAMGYRPDLQTGAESMLFMLGASASRADVLAGLGSCHNANGMSAEMMLIQKAWLDAARFLSGGIRFDGGRLGAANIAEGGPGTNFMTDLLTLEFARGGELFANGLFDYSGGHGDDRTMFERAHAKVETLTDGYESPVPGDIQDALRRHFHDLYASST